jgi:hypothetical protein
VPSRTGLSRGTKSDAWRRAFLKKSIKWTFLPPRLSLIDFKPAPPDFANNISEILLLDGLNARGRKVIADFCCLVLLELHQAKELDASPPHPTLKALTPALRQKLKSIRFGGVSKKAVSKDTAFRGWAHLLSPATTVVHQHAGNSLRAF